ncbi:MAG: SDR family NAD(P)-dependent oxidoreductase, partial [Endozoicomonadaceae bacterium]|nr:SDR family NAD(P)-dependent oxidoreductase [Endozoicomonadaceae bacterium]
LYGLVHNAGLLGERKSVGEYSPEVWAEVMQVNVNAQFLLTRALLPLLRKNENGSVIFTSSNVGIQGRANWGAYCVSKFATEGLAQLLADEEKQLSSLRINTINPGRVRTAMRAQAYPDEDPMSLVSPQEVVLTYLYLMDGDNSGITGQRINAQN